MHAKRRTVVLGIAGAAALALGAGVAWSVASKEPQPRDAKDLGRAVRQLASLARETALLADNVDARRVTARYADTQREKLSDAVHEQGESLQAPFGPLDATAAKLRDLAGDLHALLERMQRDMVPGDAMRAHAAEARRIAQAIALLEPKP